MEHSAEEMLADIAKAMADPTPHSGAKNLPPGYQHVGEVMTNFNHSIDAKVAEQLRAGPFWADYHAWEFCGVVWFDRATTEWCCDVRRYRCLQECVRRASLQEIMDYCSEKWGAD
jgi:hypothetical protein